MTEEKTLPDPTLLPQIAESVLKLPAAPEDEHRYDLTESELEAIHVITAGLLQKHHLVRSEVARFTFHHLHPSKQRDFALEYKNHKKRCKFCGQVEKTQ